jgi:hypothetical protein
MLYIQQTEDCQVARQYVVYERATCYSVCILFWDSALNIPKSEILLITMCAISRLTS